MGLDLLAWESWGGRTRLQAQHASQQLLRAEHKQSMHGIVGAQVSTQMRASGRHLGLQKPLEGDEELVALVPEELPHSGPLWRPQVLQTSGCESRCHKAVRTMRQSLAGSRHVVDTMPGVKHIEAWTTGMVCKNQTSTRPSSRTCLASEAGQAVNLHGFCALPAGASPATAMKALSSLLPLLLQDTHQQPEFHSRPASCQLTHSICTPPQACGIPSKVECLPDHAPPSQLSGAG